MIEPGHIISYKTACAFNEDSDQPEQDVWNAWLRTKCLAKNLIRLCGHAILLEMLCAGSNLIITVALNENEYFRKEGDAKCFYSTRDYSTTAVPGKWKRNRGNEQYMLRNVWKGPCATCATSSENVPSSMRKMCGFTSHCTYAKSHLGICSPLKHSIVSNNSVCGQRRPWSDCADAQADLDLRCPYVPKDTFSHGAANIRKRMPRSACAPAKSDRDLDCWLEYSIVSSDCASGQY